MADMFDKEELGIVGSLFANPLAQARAEQTQAYSRFRDVAGPSNPFAGLAGLSGMFATAAGQDLQGALGVQSPERQIMMLRQQAQQQFDTNTPDGLMQMAQFLNQSGDAAGARQAIMLAQGQQQRVAERQRTEAQAVRALREPGQLNFQQLLSSGKYTPASVAKFQQTQNPADLVLVKEATAGAGISKPLPASLQKDEGKDLEAYDSYTAQKEALGPSILNLTPNEQGVRKLELGPLKNAKYLAQNLAGNSTPESRAFEALKSAVDTAVNLQVSAEKGVQTDKDVLRFAQALIAAYGRNDTQATLEALKRYQDALDKAQNRVASRIESRRRSQGVEPFFVGQQPVPATQETPPTPAAAQPTQQQPKTRTITLKSGKTVTVEE